MRSLLLVDGDLVFQNDELVMVDGQEERVQCVRINLGTNQGEWFLDPDMGIDFGLFLGKNPVVEEMTEELRDGLHQLEFIDSVDDIQIRQNRTTRQQNVIFTLATTDGEILTEEIDINVG
ncbi:hypothetical protein [Paenibacillus popilliae]|uniref:DUF2634 domain-containing protein n=1 Tax=Paenibacillus popilliae ATCC 14706 TaxID=1212764 RepID=M9LN40_PAEPP|nr:hypothetical protein [Paenibacillus popilliae]GAC41696.1 hypothetical protein PPOP_1047 [Paenibacillus popilliae ATCC 14706]